MVEEEQQLSKVELQLQGTPCHALVELMEGNISLFILEQLFVLNCQLSVKN